MSRVHFSIHSGDIHPILGSLRSVPVPVHHEPGAAPSPPPFITASRQAGAGGHSLAERLVQVLNIADPGERGWSCWDRELVEKVAADHNVAKELVESLGEKSLTWMQEFLSGLSFHEEYASEAKVYQSVATTIRALAQAGRVIIVGRGGVYITRNMPGGIHIRLVAPLNYRVQHMAELLHCSRDEAAAEVRQLDRGREAFYKRYWPNETLAPENFSLTINTAVMDDEQIVNCILPLVRAKVPATK